MHKKCFLYTCDVILLFAALVYLANGRCVLPKENLKHGMFIYRDTLRPNRSRVPEHYLLQFRCCHGYTLRGSKAIFCNRGRWTDKVPKCIKKESCPDPGCSVDGKRSRDSLLVGDKLKYTCNDGFELVGKDTIECLQGGVWSSRRPLCVPLSDHCERPHIAHGSVKGDADRDFFLKYDLVEIECDPGYSYPGTKPKDVMCEDEGQWEVEFQNCTVSVMICDEPPAIEDGICTLNTGSSDELSVGSTAVYSCHDGYELSNSAIHTLRCSPSNDNSSLAWEGDIPSCQKKELCPDPGCSVDGKRNGNSLFVGAKLNYTCNDDFELVGEDSIECLFNGVWSSSRPLCVPLTAHCKAPPQIAHGSAKGYTDRDFYSPGEDAIVKCDPGYSYSGASKYVACDEEGRWEKEFQECTEVFCDLPEPLVNGTILGIEPINATTFPFNFELTYVCDKGFRLIGDSWRFCKEKGWSSKNPHCEVIRCPDPGVPENGIQPSNSFEIGDKVVFDCFTGYDLIGSFERYCMPNGQWDGELTRCNHVNNYCPDPGVPINGMKNSSDYNMGEIIQFQCQPGYTLLGSGIRKCLPERTWSGTEAKCLGPFDFDNSARVGERLLAAIKKREEDEKALLVSPHNASMTSARMLSPNPSERLILYFAFDVSGSVGKDNFRKSIEFAKAIVNRIGISESGTRAGALTFGSTAHTSFLPLDFKTTEDVLNALDRINYTGGGTSASSAFALVLNEMMPLVDHWLKRKKSIVFFLTDGKVNMGGDPQQKAQKLKDKNVEIYSIGITSEVMQGSLYNVASENEVGTKDDHFFILENFPTLSWLVEKITNGTIDYSRCGLGLERVGRENGLGKIVDGREVSEVWPWMAALYTTEPNMEPEFLCGGSIINETYVLTAAHCLYEDDSVEIRKESEIIVKLGLTNRKNVTNMQEFEIVKFIPHSKYKPGNIFYDYDIALLKLSRPIEFTSVIRPVCLPPSILTPQTTFYKPGQFVLTAGWGHTEVVQKTQRHDSKPVDHLKEIFLPIQSYERCRESAIQLRNGIPIEKKFTNQMFCIGDGNGGNDTCSGDSGGPVIQSQQDSEGNKYWTQIGIVSWGKGCGVPNTYGYYTHVQRLRSFIADTIGISRN